MLRRHEEEWSGFVDSLGPTFVRGAVELREDTDMALTHIEPVDVGVRSCGGAREAAGLTQTDVAADLRVGADDAGRDGTGQTPSSNR